MGTFKRFEDIKAWQKARELTSLVYQITSDGSFAKDYGLRDQIQRSSVSIMANIAEGYGRLSDKEFANFLNIARGSVAEVQSHLYVALDLGYISSENISKHFELLEEIGRMIVALAKHLRGMHQ